MKAGLQCHFTGPIQTARDLLLDVIFVGRKESCFVQIFSSAKMFTQNINLSCRWWLLGRCSGAMILYIELVLELVEISSEGFEAVKAVLVVWLVSVTTESGTDGCEVSGW